MLFIVDGTSDYAVHNRDGSDIVFVPKKKDDRDPNARYDWDMRHSFCKAMAGDFASFYHRGPGLYGFECGDILGNVEREVDRWVTNYRLPASGTAMRIPDLFLAGHSRGGGIVLELAHRLAKKNISIKGMFIFDGVDRTVHAELDHTQELPPNVEFIFHAVRDPNRLEAEIYSSKDFLIEKEAFHGHEIITYPRARQYPPQLRLQTDYEIDVEKIKLATRSYYVSYYDEVDHASLLSIDFGNILRNVPDDGEGGYIPNKKNKYFVKKFAATHGAIGGAPICDDRRATVRGDSWMYSGFLAQYDYKAMKEIWDWMCKNFRLSGLIAPTESPRSLLLPEKEFLKESLPAG